MGGKPCETILELYDKFDDAHRATRSGSNDVTPPNPNTARKLFILAIESAIVGRVEAYEAALDRASRKSDEELVQIVIKSCRKHPKDDLATVIATQFNVK